MPLVRVSDVFELRPLSYDHPDAEVLTERAQEYYVDIYGGRDEDPLAAAELTPPHGGFVLGYLDGEPVAMGGWVLVDGPESTSAYGARVAQIRRMYVDAGLRRRGLATAVLAHLETDAARFGVTMMSRDRATADRGDQLVSAARLPRHRTVRLLRGGRPGGLPGQGPEARGIAAGPPGGSADQLTVPP